MGLSSRIIGLTLVHILEKWIQFRSEDRTAVILGMHYHMLDQFKPTTDRSQDC